MPNGMRGIGAAAAVAVVLALAACAPATPLGPGATTPPASPTPAEVPECPSGGTELSPDDDLQAALDAAKPGDVIRLADGTYRGTFEITVAGEPDAPIHLCGGPGAVLDGGDVDHGIVVHLEGADHWRLLGFGVRGGQKGVMADGVEGVVLGGLVVSDIGDEAVHLRAFSVDNLVVGLDISGTGQRRPEFGEGIYIGTAESNWCEVTSCDADASDRNRVVGNTIRQTTAESIDVKEGTTGGEIRDNVFDGSALTGDADSWVDVKGNDWLIAGNSGTTSPGDGFQTHEILEGWGTGNVFRGNDARVNGPGYGFALTPELQNLVACDNRADGAARGLANVSCRDA